MKKAITWTILTMAVLAGLICSPAAFVIGKNAGIEQTLIPPRHITLGCECGGNLICPISYQPEHWPLDITCIQCGTRYITTRTSLNE